MQKKSVLFLWLILLGTVANIEAMEGPPPGEVKTRPVSMAFGKSEKKPTLRSTKGKKKPEPSPPPSTIQFANGHLPKDDIFGPLPPPPEGYDFGEAHSSDQPPLFGDRPWQLKEQPYAMASDVCPEKGLVYANTQDGSIPAPGKAEGEQYGNFPANLNRQLQNQLSAHCVPGAMRYIADGAHPDIQEDESGDTLLHLIAEQGNGGAVDLLYGIKYRRPNANIANNKKETPLDCAYHAKKRDATKALLEHGAYQFNLPLAASQGHLDLLQLLIGQLKGIDLNATNAAGQTALHTAILSGHSPTALFLLRQGATHTISDKNDKTPLHYAVAKADMKIMKSIMKRGVDFALREQLAQTSKPHIKKLLLTYDKILIDGNEKTRNERIRALLLQSAHKQKKVRKDQ